MGVEAATVIGSSLFWIAGLESWDPTGTGPALARFPSMFWMLPAGHRPLSGVASKEDWKFGRP